MMIDGQFHRRCTFFSDRVNRAMDGASQTFVLAEGPKNLFIRGNMLAAGAFLSRSNADSGSTVNMRGTRRHS
jgi:hypothetical protein